MRVLRRREEIALLMALAVSVTRGFVQMTESRRRVRGRRSNRLPAILILSDPASPQVARLKLNLGYTKYTKV